MNPIDISKLQKIGAGGQKEVYLYLDPDLGKCVVKVAQINTKEQQQRITREINLLRTLDNRYFPRIFDFTFLRNGELQILEEYVGASSLVDKEADFYEINKAIGLILELSIGLTNLWALNCVHRDLKPQNILFRDSGEPVIIDLGIVRSLTEDSITDSHIFNRGPLTLMYAAPEQIHYNKKSIDFRTDQFNLGILLAKLLLKGEHPFSPVIVGGNDYQSNILNENWASTKLKSLVSKPTFDVVSTMLGKERYTRYRTPELLIKALQSAKENEK